MLEEQSTSPVCTWISDPSNFRGSAASLLFPCLFILEYHKPTKYYICSSYNMIFFLSFATKRNIKVQQVTVSCLSTLISVCNSLSWPFTRGAGQLRIFHQNPFYSPYPPPYHNLFLKPKTDDLKFSLIYANTSGKRNSLYQYQLKAIICRETSWQLRMRFLGNENWLESCRNWVCEWGKWKTGFVKDLLSGCCLYFSRMHVDICMCAVLFLLRMYPVLYLNLA